MVLKKLSIGVLLLLCATFLSGCWNIKDLNHRVLPTVMGISHGNSHKYRVHIEVPLPEKGRTRYKVFYKEAATVSKALTEIDTDIEVGVDFMHVQLIVFDRIIAEDGIQDETALIIRSEQIPSKALLIQVSDPLSTLPLNQPQNSVNTVNASG